MNNQINIGDIVTLTGTFKVGSTLTDPTTVTLRVQLPDGTVVEYTYPATVSKTSTGIFYKDYTVTQAGLHTYWFIGTGACVAREPRSFVAQEGPPAVSP